MNAEVADDSASLADTEILASSRRSADMSRKPARAFVSLARPGSETTAMTMLHDDYRRAVPAPLALDSPDADEPAQVDVRSVDIAAFAIPDLPTESPTEPAPTNLASVPGPPHDATSTPPATASASEVAPHHSAPPRPLGSAFAPHPLEGTETTLSDAPPAPFRTRRTVKRRLQYARWPSFQPPLARNKGPDQTALVEPDRLPAIIDPARTAELSIPPPEPLPPHAQLCRPGPSPLTGSASDTPASAMAVPDTEEGHRNFGLSLARAAMAQTDEFTIYSVSYTRIAYPRGDVPALYGVCTDVIIRAYRSLGIDLQELVHLAAPRSGDRNIQHRRTEVLRKFFARHGTSLPVTDYPEDYRPGDIVTYHRPNNRASKSHIAIVTDIIAPSGRPMVVHNRGWGVQIEDALFLDQVTGHYRYFGQGLGRSDATIASTPMPEIRKGATDEPLARAHLAAITGRTAWSASGPAPDCGRGQRAIMASRDAFLCAPSRSVPAHASPADAAASTRR